MGMLKGWLETNVGLETFKRGPRAKVTTEPRQSLSAPLAPVVVLPLAAILPMIKTCIGLGRYRSMVVGCGS